MNLNELRDKAYSNACAKGFHDKEYSNKHWLMLVITELSEAVEADRKNNHFVELNDIDNYIRACLIDKKKAFEDYIKGTVEDKLADAVIRLLDLAGLRNIDLNFVAADLNFVAADFSVLSDWFSAKSFTEAIYRINASLILGDVDLEQDISGTVFILIGNIFALSKHLDIDLLWHIEQKMKYNETREPLHSKKY